jgi:hypothetical protein
MYVTVRAQEGPFHVAGGPLYSCRAVRGTLSARVRRACAAMAAAAPLRAAQPRALNAPPRQSRWAALAALLLAVAWRPAAGQTPIFPVTQANPSSAPPVAAVAHATPRALRGPNFMWLIAHTAEHPGARGGFAGPYVTVARGTPAAGACAPAAMRHASARAALRRSRARPGPAPPPSASRRLCTRLTRGAGALSPRSGACVRLRLRAFRHAARNNRRERRHAVAGRPA